MAAALVVLGAAAVLAPSARAADAHPCGSETRQPWSDKPVQPCPLVAPESGNRIPVYKTPVARGKGDKLPEPDGWLNGTDGQYFVCQERKEVFYHSQGWRNVWWAYTASDTGADWGWVPEVYFQGGDDDEADGGLKQCGTDNVSGAPAQPDLTTDCELGKGHLQSQKIRLDYPLFSRRVVVTGEPPKVIRRTDESRRYRRIGQVTMNVSSCKHKSNGAWDVSPPIAIRKMWSKGLNVITRDKKRELRPRRSADYGVGFGIELSGKGKVSATSFRVAGLYCTRYLTIWGTVKRIADLPLPGPNKAGLILYAVAQAAEIAGPDKKTRCVTLGDSRVRLRVDGGGCVRVSASQMPRRVVMGGNPGQMMEHLIDSPDVHYKTKKCKPKKRRQRPGRQP